MESELVAGFMTEHSAGVFVFFFLGEYSSLILMSAFMAIFFLGGHHLPDIHKLIFDPILYMYNNFWSNNIIPYFHISFNTYPYLLFVNYYGNSGVLYSEYWNNTLETINISLGYKGKCLNQMNESITLFSSKDTILDSINILIDKIYGSSILGLKIISVVFLFIWVRASFPRMRYDQLMSLCWKELLPLIFGYIIFTICLFYTFDMMPYGSSF